MRLIIPIITDDECVNALEKMNMNINIFLLMQCMVVEW